MMKTIFVGALAAGMLMAAAPITVAQDLAGCITHTTRGIELSNPICEFESLSELRGGPGIIIIPPVVPAPTPVPVPPTPEPSEPTCEVIPGAPIYDDVVVGYERGEPITERQRVRKTWHGIPYYVWETVIVGYEQGEPITERQIVGYEDSTEVCTEEETAS